MKRIVSDDKIHEVCKLIQDGKRNTDISKITGCSGVLISYIRHGKRHTNISRDYNLKCNADAKSEDKIREICQLLQDGKSSTEISKIVGFNPSYISLIRNKRRYQNISKDYIITPKLKIPTTDKIHEVCKLIQDGNKNADIVRLTGCCRTTISSIRHGKRYKNISKDYIMRNEPNAYNEKEIRQICQLIQDGKKDKEISLVVGYSVNRIYQIRQGKSYKYISKDYNFLTKTKYAHN